MCSKGQTVDDLLLPGKTTVIGTLTETPEQFGGDDQICATQAKYLDRASPVPRLDRNILMHACSAHL